VAGEEAVDEEDEDRADDRDGEAPEVEAGCIGAVGKGLVEEPADEGAGDAEQNRDNPAAGAPSSGGGRRRGRRVP
jgi:hypothetical protein